MHILVADNPVNVTVDIETNKAPCPGCEFYQAQGDNVPSKCLVEDRGLSSAVISDCAKLGWRREASE